MDPAPLNDNMFDGRSKVTSSVWRTWFSNVKYYFDQLTGGNGTVSPSNSVVAETGFNQSANAGSSMTFSRGDHTHGTPSNDHGGLAGLLDNDHTQYVNAVDGAPLTLSNQSIAFNYDANDFELNGNELQIKESGIDHGSLAGLSDDDHTQYLLANGTRPLSANWAVGDYSLTGIDNLSFTDVNGQVAGIENQNLLDKTANETISGDYTYNGNQYLYSANIDETSSHNFMQLSTIFNPSANNSGTLNALMVAPATAGSSDFTNVQACQIVGIHNIDQRVTNLYGVRCQVVTGGIFSDGNGWATTAIGGEFQAFNRSNSSNTSTNLEGGRFISDVRASSNVTNVVGGRFQIKKSSTSTVDNYYGMIVDPTYITAGTINHLYGIEIGDLSGCTLTNAPIGINIQNQSDANAVGIRFHTMGISIDSQNVSTYMNHKGNIHISWDDRGLYLGTDQDSSITYDGTDLIINPAEVGSGAVKLLASDAVTNDITNVQKLTHETSGTAANGLGISTEYELEDDSGNVQVAADTSVLWADASNGNESPLKRSTVYPQGTAPGYHGIWGWSALDGTTRTVVPNGDGDVTTIMTVQFAIKESGGGTEGGTAVINNNSSVDLYDDGTDICTLTVAADGSVSIARSAGAATFDVMLNMVWI